MLSLSAVHGKTAAPLRFFMVGLLAAFATGSARADEPVSFKGKTVTMIIGFAAGGGTDLAGRLIAAHLGKYLPGQPNVIVQNIPGAEGMTAMNYFANQAKPDGLTLTMGSGSVADPINFRKPQAKYDPSKFLFVGGTGRGGTLTVINKGHEANLTDRSKPQVIMGSPGGAPRSGVLVTAWGIEFLGWNAKWVVGYKGTNDLFTALERGEIDMAATSSTHMVEKLLKTGKFKMRGYSHVFAIKNDGKTGQSVLYYDATGAVQEQPADLFAEGRASRLAQGDDVAAFGFQVVLEELDLSTLAGCLAALEGDEHRQSLRQP